MAEINKKEIDEDNEETELNIFKYVVHYARVYNYNNETYKWRRVIPIKKVFNSWIVIPLFSEKAKVSRMKNYFLIDELSTDDKKVYVDLSRQEKILIDPKNFKKEPIKEKGTVINIKKSTIKSIQLAQNIYLYDELSILKEKEVIRINNVDKNLDEDEEELS